MRTQVQKWGNSLAVRIPSAFAKNLGLEQNAPVDLTLEDGTLVLRPQSKYQLEGLLEQVTDDNLHDEQDFGPAVGREAW